jgi:hypothetical protein
MSATIIDFTAHRARHDERIVRAREDAFDQEIVRRLRALLAGLPIPAQPIPDNPYAPDAFCDDVEEDEADRRPFAPDPAA